MKGTTRLGLPCSSNLRQLRRLRTGLKYETARSVLAIATGRAAVIHSRCKNTRFIQRRSRTDPLIHKGTVATAQSSLRAAHRYQRQLAEVRRPYLTCEQ